MRVSIINFTVPVFAQLYLPYLIYVYVRVRSGVDVCVFVLVHVDGEECVDVCVRVGGEDAVGVFVCHWCVISKSLKLKCDIEIYRSYRKLYYHVFFVINLIILLHLLRCICYAFFMCV